jgi:uncharacterized protein
MSNEILRLFIGKSETFSQFCVLKLVTFEPENFNSRTMVVFIISIIFTVIGGILSARLRSKFAKYSQMPVSSGRTGAEMAKQMLTHYGINDVQIIQVEGQLTDHYNPTNKTVNLSYDVYHGRHVSAAAVATHECGHAVQHAKSYAWLQMRSKMVPAVQIASTAQQWLFMLGMAGAVGTGSSWIMFAVCAAFGVTALFSLVTLPVEFDASARALAWLDETGTAQGAEYAGAKDALFWAAMTYVSAALAALLQFLYLLLRLTGSND